MQGICFAKDCLCAGEKQLMPRLLIRASVKAVTCNAGYSPWMPGVLAAVLWFETVFPDVTVSPQSTG